MRLLILASALLAVGCSQLSLPDPVANRRVNEHVFVKVCLEGNENMALKTLGTPDRQGEGELVQYDRGEGPIWLIAEALVTKSPNHFYFYSGTEGQIELLYSGQTKRLIAGEYSIEGQRVWYFGEKPRTARRISPGYYRMTTSDDPQIESKKKLLTQFFAKAFTLAQKPEETATASPPRAETANLPAAGPATAQEAPRKEETPKKETQPAAREEVASASPREPAPPTLPAEPEHLDPFQQMGTIQLPSGREFAKTDILLPMDWSETYFPSPLKVRLAYYEDGSLRMALSVVHNRLQGPAVGLHPSGNIATLASYEDGELSGPLRLWNDQQEMVLYSEYAQAKPDGLTVLFKDHKPLLIQEYREGKLDKDYLVEVSDKGKAILNDRDTEALAAINALAKELKRFNQQILKNEAFLKDQLRAAMTSDGGSRNGHSGSYRKQPLLKFQVPLESQWRDVLRGSVPSSYLRKMPEAPPQSKPDLKRTKPARARSALGEEM